MYGSAIAAAAGVPFALLASSAGAQTELTLWYYVAGKAEDRRIMAGIIEDFNASQQDWRVGLQEFPQAAYSDSVTAAALSNKLPDTLDVDGPNMPNWAWAGYLQPLRVSEDR